MRSELAEIAFTDNLTSCLNRNGFEYALDQMIDGAARDEEEIAILAVDIDHFKASTTRSGISWATWCCVRWRCCCSTLHRAGRRRRTRRRRGVRDTPARRRQRDGGGDRRAADGFDSLACLPIPQGTRRVTISVGIASERVTEPHIAGALQSESGRGTLRREATGARSSGAVGARNAIERDATVLEKGVGFRITPRSKRPNAAGG